jgi:hypothetical protein
MPESGELSRKFGVYRTLCCDAEIVIGVGVPFPDCPKHRSMPTEWKELEDADHSSNGNGSMKHHLSEKTNQS